VQLTKAHTSHPHHRRDAWLLRLIGLFKLSKTLALSAAAISVFHLRHRNLVEIAERWGRRLHFAPGNKLLDDLIDKLMTVTKRQLMVAGFVLLAYAGMFLIEGIGLLMLKYWAEWMTVITSAGLIPIELYEIFRRPTWLKILAVIVNVAVAVYLAVRVRREAVERRQHRQAAISGA
jgi:uncharacterized membrane protein (DUF2068 family)